MLSAEQEHVNVLIVLSFTIAMDMTKNFNIGELKMMILEIELVVLV